MSVPPGTGDVSDQARTVEVHPGKEAVVDFDPGLTFECVDECTWCCHHGVLLYEPDLLALADRASLAETTTEFRGQDFVRKEEKEREEHTYLGPNFSSVLSTLSDQRDGSIGA